VLRWLDPPHGTRRAVSILTGPGGPVLRIGTTALACYNLVSILTGPGGPVLPPASGYHFDYSPGFQSSPGPEARCYQIAPFAFKEEVSFNPHRARRPGAT